MAPSSKSTAAAKDRRRSNNTAAAAAASVTSASSSKTTLLVALKVPPKKLRAIVDPDFIKEDTPVKQSPAAAPNSSTENASDSTPNSPPAGTPAAQSANMGPPSDGPKKKGVKRSAGAAANGNGEPKVRGKPGPKKKQRLEDGTLEPPGGGGGRGSLAAHRLGPKANQGAINAGLRALDRSGKPCRKWARGGFTLKTFTGVVWEIPRWTAPPKLLLARPEGESDNGSNTPASVDSSNKENHGNGVGVNGNKREGGEDASQVKSEAVSQNGGGDGGDLADVQSAPSFVADASPAPVPVAAV